MRTSVAFFAFMLLAVTLPVYTAPIVLVLSIKQMVSKVKLTIYLSPTAGWRVVPFLV